MNITDPVLIDRIAAAYVLGTLKGAARRRFERLTLESDGRPLQSAVWRWERRLNVMVNEVAPITPPARVWDGIIQSIEGVPDTVRRGPSGWLWRTLSAGLAVAVLALAIPYFQPAVEQTAVPPIVEQLALIESEDQQPLWVITLDLENGTLRSRAVNTPARDVDRVFELWLLPGEGEGAPRSVGLLPLDAGERAENRLSPAILALLQRSQGLAVSIEPSGGSPTGLPTGPVVYTAPLLEL